MADEKTKVRIIADISLELFSETELNSWAKEQLENSQPKPNGAAGVFSFWFLPGETLDSIKWEKIDEDESKTDH